LPEENLAPKNFIFQPLTANEHKNVKVTYKILNNDEIKRLHVNFGKKKKQKNSRLQSVISLMLEVTK